MKAMLTACAASICLGLAAAEVEWFDAGINSYTNFPGSGETLVVDGAGTWTNITGSVTLTNNCIKLENEASVEFELAKTRDITATTTNTIIIVAENVPLSGSLHDVSIEVKGGIIPAKIGEDDACYYGIAKNGETNAWVKLTGATPTENTNATFKIDYRINGTAAQVRYQVDKTVLMNGGNEWSDVVCNSDKISEVSFTGNGDLAGLSGNVSTGFGASDEIVAALVSSNKVYGTWLLKMAEGSEAESVQEALNNGISLDALRACLLANVVPTEDTVELEIPSITFVNGQVVIGGANLKVNNVDQGNHTVNGTIRIYRAGSIADLNSMSTGGDDLGHQFPVEAQNLGEMSTTGAAFFQLRIEP